ncbi:hypothetical protein KSD_45270 [Ktedonobacter sp. SOSP1-85]|uniref:antibiotic biosynthesis monooxygenase n=1 Tax=Ktedonobacter sp. SOSP1-85 TaxID=2778367 RepID=UPI00191685F5|nr:antibiotic biosynthesis monooxygenase [Ktedonobacter sp. SOSP1-85]GHO76756.1 hypothetical protein KSD_45270 [Ktedonobacter sp. SOSP1-85]
MAIVGTLTRVEVKSGNEALIVQALQEAFSIVQQEHATTTWVAFRQEPSVFNVFDVFSDEAGRQAYYQARWPQLQTRASQLFVEGSLAIEKVDILLAKLPE